MNPIRAILNFLWPNEVEEVCVVGEDSDELGYYLTKSFFGASKETKRILLGIMPETEWDEIRNNALDAHEKYGNLEYEHDRD